MFYIVLQEKRVATSKKKNHLHLWRNFSADHIQARRKVKQKRQKLFHLWHNRVDTSLDQTFNRNFFYISNLYIFSLH